MSQEIPPKITASDLDLERYIDRPFDLVARVRAAKEAAQREMETFGNVSEYEIRKIFGQKTQLSYDTPEKERTETQSPIIEAREKSSPPVITREAESNQAQAAFDFSQKELAPNEDPVKEG